MVLPGSTSWCTVVLLELTSHFGWCAMALCPGGTASLFQLPLSATLLCPAIRPVLLPCLPCLSRGCYVGRLGNGPRGGASQVPAGWCWRCPHQTPRTGEVGVSAGSKASIGHRGPCHREPRDHLGLAVGEPAAGGFTNTNLTGQKVLTAHLGRGRSSAHRLLPLPSSWRCLRLRTDQLC